MGKKWVKEVIPENETDEQYFARLKRYMDMEPDAKIINVMSDGHIEEDLTGHIIPLTPETRRFYELVVEAALRG